MESLLFLDLVPLIKASTHVSLKTTTMEQRKPQLLQVKQLLYKSKLCNGGVSTRKHFGSDCIHEGSLDLAK